ncbi:MAG TPA: cystathionine beta-lyase [Rhodospirillaceae bacterium]|nr:cystathionine beta-lyase [Candidatus Neomarinimicrobiota bacterium]HCX14927.1 cystathionine beta-lyase [Rhodospirillaceae bacterium]
MKKDTKVIRAGNDKTRNAGIVNTPVFHASTIVFDSVKAMNDADERGFRRGEKVMYYGRRGTPTHWTLQDAITELAGGADTVLAPSGLGACVLAIMGSVKSGDHILVTDSVYGPTRGFCNGFLKNFGVETTFFDPLLGSNISKVMQPNTTLVFCESPGTHTFEVQDLPAIADAAHEGGAKVAADNTWASPWFCNPIALGADISIEAATKYIVGHSDANMGTVTCTTETLPGVQHAYGALGLAIGVDDVYLATRGLRTLPARLKQHQDSAIKVAGWLKEQPNVKRVLYPPLIDDPGHAIWARDFSGGSGLFSVVFDKSSSLAAAALIDGMELFTIGYSWGGFESLIVPSMPSGARSATKWTEPEPGIRLHIGLEDPEDLIADLDRGLARFRRALG